MTQFNRAKFMQEITEQLQLDYPCYHWTLFDITEEAEEPDEMDSWLEIELKKSDYEKHYSEAYFTTDSVGYAVEMIETMFNDVGYL